MADTAAFPKITPKPHLQVKEDLPGQIYTIDGFLSDAELANVLRWAQMTTMKDPTKPGKGEAERTARRGAIDSPDIAQAILDALSPHLSHLDPPYRPSVPLLSPNIRIYHYPPKTFFRGHYDSPQMDMRSKRLSCWTVLVYLSNGVKGGGTTFWLDDPDRDGASAKGAKGKVKGGDAGKGKGAKAGKGVGKEAARGKGGGGGSDSAAPRSMTFEPKAGRVLLHWHGVARGGCMLHEGDEVVSGDKWVLRTDVLA